MNIILCTSKAFIRDAETIAHDLERMGHSVHVPARMEVWGDHAKEKAQESLHEFTHEFQYMHEHFERIKQSDGLIVLNFQKYGIPGYVGGGMLMDMGFAHAMRKPIFLLYPIPRLPYQDEIEITDPVILHGSIAPLKKFLIRKQVRVKTSAVKGAGGTIGRAKRVVTYDAQGKENGFLMELLKEGRFTKTYLTAVKPGSFKGYHLHRVRETNYVAVRGVMKIVLYVKKGSSWAREEHRLDSREGSTLRIPVNVATGFMSATDEEAWLVNFPNPPYDPELKNEQVEYTEEELKKGIVK